MQSCAKIETCGAAPKPPPRAAPKPPDADAERTTKALCATLESIATLQKHPPSAPSAPARRARAAAPTSSRGTDAAALCAVAVRRPARIAPLESRRTRPPPPPYLPRWWASRAVRHALGRWALGAGLGRGGRAGPRRCQIARTGSGGLDRAPPRFRKTARWRRVCGAVTTVAALSRSRRASAAFSLIAPPSTENASSIKQTPKLRASTSAIASGARMPDEIGSRRRPEMRPRF